MGPPHGTASKDQGTDKAIRPLKSDRSGDAVGVVAELWKSAIDDVLQHMHGHFNHVLLSGFCPQTRRRILFSKKTRQFLFRIFARLQISDCCTNVCSLHVETD